MFRSNALSDATICAPATPPGEAPIAVIRLSGPQALSIADRVFRSRSGKDLTQAPAFTVHYGHIVDAGNDRARVPAEGGWAKEVPRCGSIAAGSPDPEAIDEVLVTIFRAPKSYTGEDMVEISCHGGPYVRSRILRLLVHRGASPAAPGEFTKRAFLSGRMDLAQAEAVQDVIRARGEAALKNAAEQLDGALSRTIRSLRSELLDELARLEAAIDFPDEDIEILDREALDRRVQSVSQRIGPLLQGAAMGRFLREGIRTVIAGRPNVGKSSLLNRLIGTDRAIVTDVPGTTRDTIEEEIQLERMRFRLSDTAGLVRSGDRVEKIGVERARQLIAQADLVLFVVDGSVPLERADHRVADSLGGQAAVIRVVNKCDLPLSVRAEELRGLCGPVPEVRVSALDGTGIGLLEKALVDEAVKNGGGAPESSWVTNLRHREALETAQSGLERTRQALKGGEPPEIVAVDLKETLDALGEIIGEVTTEDLLDRIFSQFCIGK